MYSINTNFFDENNIDLGRKLVSKEYLLSYYPDIANTIITPELWVWGSNTSGKLGDNTTVNKITPVTTFSGGANWKQVSCGWYHAAAVKTDGTLWMWGSNSSGQLGDNTNTDRSTPVTTFSGGTNWKQVSCGGYHTAAIKTDGTLWIWGENSSGQLGDNTNTDRSTPVTTFSGGTNWKQVSCGYVNSAATKTDGTLWLWGFNGSGQLGDNTTISRVTPVSTFVGGTNWKQVSCSEYHTAAIKTDGTLWIWGNNAEGQLGDNTIINRSTPVTTFSGGTNWKQISCNFYNSTALKSDGSLWSWGANYLGQLGINLKGSSRITPVTTYIGGNNWSKVSCGREVNGAIKTDGTLWLWGRNSGGEVGDNTTFDRFTPVTTIVGGNSWKQVSCGFIFNSAIKSVDVV